MVSSADTTSNTSELDEGSYVIFQRSSTERPSSAANRFVASQLGVINPAPNAVRWHQHALVRACVHEKRHVCLEHAQSRKNETPLNEGAPRRTSKPSCYRHR